MEAAEETVDVLRQRLHDLRSRLRSIRDERAGIIEELKSLRQKRREMIDRVRSMREEARELIERRREIWREIDEIKRQKEEALSNYRKARETAEEWKRKYDDVVSEVGVPERVLRRRIAALERRIETQSLSIDVERELVMRIGHLEAQLQSLVAAKEFRRKYIEAMAEAERWRFFVRDANERIKERRSQLRELSGQISSIMKELDSTRAEIDKLTEEIAEKNKKVDEMKAEMDVIFKQIQEVRQKMKEIYSVETETVREAEERIRKRLAEEAREKYRAGEKLSFEELKALMETGGLGAAEGSAESSRSEA